MWSSFCTQWPKAALLTCESQGALPVAACESLSTALFTCVVCTFGLGLWQMLDADGLCLMVVLYMVLPDILAERCLARRTQACWKGCFTLAGASLADSGLLQVGLFPVAVHVICPLGWYLGKSGETQARRRRRRGKTASIRADREQKCHRHDTKLPHTHAS